MNCSLKSILEVQIKKEKSIVFSCVRASRTLLLRVILLYTIMSTFYAGLSLMVIEVPWRVLWGAMKVLGRLYRMALHQPVVDVHRDLCALNADPVATNEGVTNFTLLEAVLVLLLEKNLANIDCIFAHKRSLAVPPRCTIWAIE